MRIGELAAAVGVTTRAVRHYHHLGLLPEPERRPNGYRDYTLRHAVVLARIRRLTELGLGLAEVRDVLADDEGRELVEVLAELDEDLARQEAAVQERRARLRELMTEGLTAEEVVSPELAAIFGKFADVSDGSHVDHASHVSHTSHVSQSAMAAKDRELFALFETTAGPEDRKRMLATLESYLAAPGAVERAQEAYALLDALVDAEPDDPRVERAVEVLVELIPQDLVPDADFDHDGSFLRAFYADFAPAQAEAIRRALRRGMEGSR
ncbi:MerR family transcriptional regulator [Streptomyces sp. NPDC002845]